LLKAKTDKLREQKKGMMQVLLTGKKRLKIDNNQIKHLKESEDKILAYKNMAYE
jgi:hypothetical protein